jgi:hypothetical protein
VHIRIEAAHLAQDQFATFDAGLARSFAKRIAKRTAQAVSSRMGEDQEATRDRSDTGADGSGPPATKAAV